MPTPVPEPTQADDIASLQARLQLPAFHYVDMAERLELRAALQRWPVLGMLHEAARRKEAST